MGVDDPRTRSGAPGRGRPVNRKRQTAPPRVIEPHHRRRRALALGVLALVVLMIAVSALSGGGAVPRRGARKATVGFFSRIDVLSGSGEGSFAEDEQAAENAAIDRTLALTPYVRVAGAQHRELALTFDDGPGPFTPRLLSVLEQLDAPATFFEVGALEKYFHASTVEQVAHGYPIGDHTQDHAPMSKLSPKDQQSELLKQVSSIGTYGAPFPRLFRPPYGLWNATTLAVLRQYKMLMVMWTVDTADYQQPGVDAIVHAAVSGAQPGAIILMHDAGGQRQQTIDALPQIISMVRAQGYKLVTVPRLLLDNPAPADQQLRGGGTVSGGG